VTAKNGGETGVFKEARGGFPEVKLEIQTVIPPRQYRGKCTNTFKRYCRKKEDKPV